MSHLIQNPEQVRFDRQGVELEFGAIGKGYAIERAVELMRDEYEIESALFTAVRAQSMGLAPRRDPMREYRRSAPLCGSRRDGANPSPP